MISKKPCTFLCDAYKNNCADHKENLNEPRGRSALLCEAMEKLAFSSFISKYSCLALFSPLASLCLLSLASSPFPSLLLRFLFSGCLLSSYSASSHLPFFLLHLFSLLHLLFLLLFVLLSPLSCSGSLQISWCKSSCSSTLLYWIHPQSNKGLID